MLPSEIPRLATDPPVRVFPGVWKLLSFLRPPSWDGSPSLPHLSLFLSFIYFVLTPFEYNGLPFWMPNVLFQHSEVVLWNLLNVQIFFWWICGGESVPVLFLCHLRTAHPKCAFWYTAMYTMKTDILGGNNKAPILSAPSGRWELRQLLGCPWLGSGAVSRPYLTGVVPSRT